MPDRTFPPSRHYAYHSFHQGASHSRRPRRRPGRHRRAARAYVSGRDTSAAESMRELSAIPLAPRCPVRARNRIHQPSNARHAAQGATQMIHQPASQPRPARRGFPSIRRWATGLTMTAMALLARAPAALAVPLPPPDGGGPVILPPPVTTAAHLPPWTVAALVTATIVLSVATTLITMSVEQ